MRSSLLATVSKFAVTFGAAGLLYGWARPKRALPGATIAGRRELGSTSFRSEVPAAGSVPDAELAPGSATGPGDITRDFLLSFILPLPVAAGVADWACHRASDIEDTAGTKETLLHLLQLIEAGIPILAGLFLEITSPVLALMIASLATHEAAALLGMSYAETRRDATRAARSQVHRDGPVDDLALVAFLHRPQFLALFGLGPEAPDLSIRLRRDMPSSPLPAVLAGSAVLFEASLYLEELWRDLGRHPGGHAG